MSNKCWSYMFIHTFYFHWELYQYTDNNLWPILFSYSDGFSDPESHLMIYSQFSYELGIGKCRLLIPGSKWHLDFCMQSNFSTFCFPSKFVKILCFHTKFCQFIIWVSNILDLEWGPTLFGASSGSKLFEKFINSF